MARSAVSPHDGTGEAQTQKCHSYDDKCDSARAKKIEAEVHDHRVGNYNKK
jgi:hypothetical protein